METSPAPLDLVVFASTPRCDGLHRELVELGHPIRVTHARDWISDPTFRCLHPVVFFLEQRSYPRDGVRSLLECASDVPTLGVFPRDEPICDSAILAQCTDFLAWPCQREELALRLRLAGVRPLGGSDNAELAGLLDEFGRMGFIGTSPAFVDVLQLIDKLAQSDAPVLIPGETGTGKELAARAIHYRSARRYHPFIPVNCGAIPDALVENELFGHERGAFTDAKLAQRGLVAEAEAGTLFLDEVDALSGKAQVALLRFLQDQEYRPLGASRVRKADARIIAATNTDLQDRVEQREFRQDLLFRLKILVLSLPPLRARHGDIPLLAEHFVSQYARRYEQPRKNLGWKALEWMDAHPWPGNVRELDSVIHRSFLIADGSTIELADLVRGAESHSQASESEAAEEFDEDFNRAKAVHIAQFEKRYLRWLMSEVHGNVTRAAKRAGKERRALGKLLKKHGIQPSRYSSD